MSERGLDKEAHAAHAHTHKRQSVSRTRQGAPGGVAGLRTKNCGIPESGGFCSIYSKITSYLTQYHLIVGYPQHRLSDDPIPNYRTGHNPGGQVNRGWECGGKALRLVFARGAIAVLREERLLV